MKPTWRRLARPSWYLLVLALLVGAFGLGYWIRGGPSAPERTPTPEVHPGAEAKVEMWTCAMHPQIRSPKPGKCLICFMDLVPVATEASEAALGPRELKLSPQAQKLAGVEVAPVERKWATAEIRMVGKVEYDETRLGYITAWVPGRLDRLFVDYTGVPVSKGDHMVYMYSPSLLTDQRSLLEAPETEKDIYRERLLLKGLTEEQVREIEERGAPSDHLTIYAPMGGIVVHKNAFEGMYVETGSRIYTIADLSQVWVRLDAYEADLPWIRYGQTVDFETEAYPGETFKGRIAFIDPVLNPMTRTVKVRVNADNPEGKLKPQMFVHALVRSQVAAGGKVIDPDLAGKWISPMHPEIVKDGPGTCDVCGMPLVRAESLGYVSVDAAERESPLVIPSSAPLITGKRAVVYVAVPEKQGVYEGREIVLGPRAGDSYLVQEGLQEGELVVVNGNFKIDSEIQIQARPSMMNPEGGGPAPGHQHGGMGTTPTRPGAMAEAPFSVPEDFKRQLEPLYAHYFAIQQALAGDNLAKATGAADQLLKALAAVDMSILQGPAHTSWMKESDGFHKAGEGIRQTAEINKAREQFRLLSDSAAMVARRFGAAGDQPILRFHCPMAFNNQGADWLQNRPEVENPYFGAAMFKCGEKVETLVMGHQHEGSESR